MTGILSWFLDLLRGKKRRYTVVIIQPANLRLSNRGNIPANYTLEIVSGTPAVPGVVLHTETGVVVANSRTDFALATWTDVPVGFAGFARLTSDQQLDFITFILSSVIDATIRDVAGVGGLVTVTYLGNSDAPLTPTYEFVLPAGGTYVCTAIEFPPPVSAQRVQFSAKFGLTFSYEALVEGLAK